MYFCIISNENKRQEYIKFHLIIDNIFLKVLFNVLQCKVFHLQLSKSDPTKMKFLVLQKHAMLLLNRS